MITKSFEPKSEVLKKYIHFYYFSEKENSKENTAYWVFPHVKTTITFEIISYEKDVFFGISGNQKFTSQLITNFNKPILFTEDNVVKELTIVFNTLGINSFINKSLNHFTDGFVKFYLPYESYASELIEVVSETDELKKCDLLESHLLKNLNPFEHPFLYDVVNDLNQNTEISFNEICSKYKITQKTLIKHFKFHIGKTPSNFRAVLRFRKAYEYYQSNKNFINLSQLPYIFYYFDQSHLIKDFRKITGHNPKDFFNQITQTEIGKINRLFLKG